MAKESSLQFFPIDWFVKEVYRVVVKVLHKYNGLRRKNSLLIWNIFNISLKENIVFVTLFETSFGSDILAPFIEFQCQGTDIFGSIWV